MLADCADAHPVADGLADAGHVIKTPLAGAHHDGAGMKVTFIVTVSRTRRLRDDCERAGSGSKRGETRIFPRIVEVLASWAPVDS